jgi:dynein heavy chain, axonemal
MKGTTENLKKYLIEYNELNKKSKINIVLFEFLVEFMIKIHRLIKQPFSHGILIGIEGSGKH